MDRAYKDISSLETAFNLLSIERLCELFTYDEAIEMASWILSQHTDNKQQALQMLDDHFNPNIVTSEITIEGAAADGFRDGEIFDKVSQGQRITWAYDPIHQPFNAEGIAREIIYNISTYCGASFNETGDRSADIYIGWSALSIAFGKVGVEFHPAIGSRVANEPHAGDIVFDINSNWKKGEYFKTVLRFYLGRLMGLPFSDDTADLLYPSFEQFREFQPGDKAKLLALYP